MPSKAQSRYSVLFLLAEIPGCGATSADICGAQYLPRLTAYRMPQAVC